MMTWALRPHGVRTCGEKKKKEVAGEAEDSEIVVSEGDEAPSLLLPANQDAAESASSPSTKSEANSHVQTNEIQETLPIDEKRSEERLATIPSATRASELTRQQDKASDAVMNLEGDCPSSCPSTAIDKPTAPAPSAPKGIRRRWKPEPPECTSAPPTGVEPGEPGECSPHSRQLQSDKGQNKE